MIPKNAHPVSWGSAVLLISTLILTLLQCRTSHEPLPVSGEFPDAIMNNIDPQGLFEACAVLNENPDTRCLLVERNGVIIAEKYFNGASRDEYFDVRSVTKSITSILIGIAIDQQNIKNVDQTVAEYLSEEVELLSEENGNISIRDLLKMTSGLPWRELNSTTSDYNQWVNSSNPLQWILSKPLQYEPGQFWNYNTGACHILSAILNKAGRKSALEFARENLFAPLGEEAGEWIADRQGYNFGGHGISMTGRMMIKTGRLYLDKGLYGNQRIISEAWITESTAYYASTNAAVPWGTGYGYLWWLGNDEVTGLSFYFAMGYGGQFIINIPERNTVIAAATRWSGVSDAGASWYLVLSTIVRDILPALKP